MTDIHRVRELKALLEERERFFDGRLAEAYRSTGVSTPQFALPRLKAAYLSPENSTSSLTTSGKREKAKSGRKSRKKSAQNRRRDAHLRHSTEVTSSAESEKSYSLLADDEYSLDTAAEHPPSRKINLQLRSSALMPSQCDLFSSISDTAPLNHTTGRHKQAKDLIHKEVSRTNALERKLRSRRTSTPFHSTDRFTQSLKIMASQSPPPDDQRHLQRSKKRASGGLMPEAVQAFSMTDIMRKAAEYDVKASMADPHIRDELSILTNKDQHSLNEGLVKVEDLVVGEASRKKQASKIVDKSRTPWLTSATPRRSSVSDTYSTAQSYIQKTISTTADFQHLGSSPKREANYASSSAYNLPTGSIDPSYRQDIAQSSAQMNISSFTRRSKGQVGQHEEHDYFNDVRFLSLLDALVPCIETKSERATS